MVTDPGRSVACPQCHAREGEPCVTKTGNEAHRSHRSRMTLAGANRAKAPPTTFLVEVDPHTAKQITEAGRLFVGTEYDDLDLTEALVFSEVETEPVHSESPPVLSHARDFTTQQQEGIKLYLEHLEEGNGINAACEYSGIPKVTVYDWLAKGRAGQEPYAWFARQHFRLRSAVRSEYLQKVKQVAGMGMAEPGAALNALKWYLEKQFPADFVAPQEIQISQKAPDFSNLTTDEMVTFRNLLAKCEQ